MKTEDARRNPVLEKLVDDLDRALGKRLRCVILYGSAARGVLDKAVADLNVLLVTESLDPGTLEDLGTVLTRWTRRGQPMPRFFSSDLLSEAADVFPIEFHDIRSHGIVLQGENPLTDLTLDPEHLRLQCEREMREKMMRLREGYIQTHGKPRGLTRLMTESYSSFVALFRGCLHLMGESVPVHNDEVVTSFCATADLDPAPLRDVGRVKQGERPADPRSLFLRYYESLEKAVHRVNRFETDTGGRTS